MDRPDINRPPQGNISGFRMVARTRSIEEAEQTAMQYRIQGFDTRITRSSQGNITLYEVWVAKTPDIIS
jgi:hypothetical protein